MPERYTWIIDFDETLASGSMTWAFEQAFPKFIAEHHFSVDTERLKSLSVELQEAASRRVVTLESLVNRLFEGMGWNADLQDQFLHDLFSSYTPVLFDDTTPFLERLRERNDRVLIVSNNPRTLDQVPLLGISNYFQGVFTPSSIPGALPKPHRSMWDHICENLPEIDPQHTIVVGDDPWSEGGFAEACGLQCWIVDRMDRFADVSTGKRYERVRSLLEIPL